jgi:hypothetical protein
MDKHITEHSNLREEAAKHKFFCGNVCKGKWIGKEFGFANKNHPHWKPYWLRNQKDPRKDYSKLSDLQIQNLWDFHLEALGSEEERDKWLIARGYYNIPPPCS